MEDSIDKSPAVPILSCLSWISFAWTKHTGKFTSKSAQITYLPDPIVFDILIKLPAADVLRFQRVCKTWKALISTKEFYDLHLKQTKPTLIAHFIRRLEHEPPSMDEIEVTELCLVEDWRVASKHNDHKKFRFGFMIPPGGGLPNILHFSFNGLLVFRPRMCSHFPRMASFLICNPVTRERLTLTLYAAHICGMFFHPRTKEHMVLSFGFDELLKTFSYKMCSLKQPPSPWIHVAGSSYSPRVSSSPVLLDGALHWIVFQVFSESEFAFRHPDSSESILIFNISTKDFSVKPYPEDSCTALQAEHCKLNILEMEGHLALFKFHIYEQEMHLFVLEDYADWVWTKRYTICLEIDLENKPFLHEEQVIALGVLDGELLIHWRTRGLFCYHPKKGTMRRYRWPERDDYYCASRPQQCFPSENSEDYCRYIANLSIFTGSLVSLTSAS